MNCKNVKNLDDQTLESSWATLKKAGAHLTFKLRIALHNRAVMKAWKDLDAITDSELQKSAMDKLLTMMCVWNTRTTSSSSKEDATFTWN